MKLETEEIRVADAAHFETMGMRCDIGLAVETDVKAILKEAGESHADELDSMYDTGGIAPDKVRVFMSDGAPVFGMVIYTLPYRDGKGGAHAVGRYACGHYHPIYDGMLCPHPYQGSVCW